MDYQRGNIQREIYLSERQNKYVARVGNLWALLSEHCMISGTVSLSSCTNVSYSEQSSQVAGLRRDSCFQELTVEPCLEKAQLWDLEEFGHLKK